MLRAADCGNYILKENKPVLQNQCFLSEKDFLESKIPVGKSL